LFTPEKILIDGTEHKVSSLVNWRGNESYYEIRIGKQLTPMFLPPRMFFLIGCLALLRDRPSGISFETEEQLGFVHRDQLSLSKSTMNNYVYCTRIEVRKQARQMSRDDRISSSECYDLLSWPVIESGAAFGLESYWRLAAPPESVVINPQKISTFPDLVFQNLVNGYIGRRQLPTRYP